MKYKLLIEQDAEKLSIKVTSYLETGWKLFGVTLASDTNFWAQAVIFDEKLPDTPVLPVVMPVIESDK